MDKIAGLKEILALDPKNSFARYGIAMELASRGETCCAWRNSTRFWPTILITLPAISCPRKLWREWTERTEAIERLKAGIGCAARAGNSHALSEMQAMLDELDQLSAVSGFCRRNGFADHDLR